MKVETSTLSLTEKAVAAIQTAVAGVIKDHRQRGKPLAVWRDGMVVQEPSITADGVHETVGHYQADQCDEDLDDSSDEKKGSC
jgi:hypothetical protein